MMKVTHENPGTRQRLNSFENLNPGTFGTPDFCDPLRPLRLICDAFVNEAKKIDASHQSTFDWVVGQMHSMNYHVFAAQSAGVDRNKILDSLAAVRAIQAQSPFVDRLQNWPRGYQGDFETVEYLMRSINNAEPHTLGYWIEQYCLNTAVAQQHRNKVRWQAEQITKVIDLGYRTNSPARILILACGSCPDVRMCLDGIADKRFEIVLNDMDQSALEFSRERLLTLGERLKLIKGNMFRQINKFAENGPFDLVLAGGLFDYLTDDQVSFLLRAVTSKLLSRTGKFVFTNIARPNAYKCWMEYCANWFLTERTEDDFSSLFGRCAIDLRRVSIDQEPCGMTLLLEVDP
jgi:extracellular factor (EF) 3-hydroxypalmitic acid methyl ester biosynthesis protein